MKKEYYFTGGSIEIYLDKPTSIHADSLEDAEHVLAEHIRSYGNQFGGVDASGGEVVTSATNSAPVETCPH